MKKTVLTFLQFLLFLSIGAAILYFVYRSQNAAFQEDCRTRALLSPQYFMPLDSLGDLATLGQPGKLMKEGHDLFKSVNPQKAEKKFKTALETMDADDVGFLALHDQAEWMLVLSQIAHNPKFETAQREALANIAAKKDHLFSEKAAAFSNDLQGFYLRTAQSCNLIGKLVADFKSANFGWIALVLLAFVISNVSRTIKWNLLLEPMGYRPRFINGFLSILVGYFANLGLPRMGEVVRAGVFSKYENIPAEKVMGTIVVDRVVDVLCLALAFGLALIFESEKLLGYLHEKMGSGEDGDSSGGSVLLWLALIGVAGLVGLFVFRKKIAQTALFQRLNKILKGFWEGIQAVLRLKRPGLFIFHSLNIWVLYFLMTWLGFQAFGPTAHLDLRAALTVFAFGTLGMLIPSPGGMGTFHALVIASLTLFYGINSNDAFSVANLIFFSVSIGFNITLGLISLILLPILNKNYKKREV